MRKKIISAIVFAILCFSLVTLSACANSRTANDSNNDKVNVGNTEKGESDTKKTEKESESYSNPNAVAEMTDEQGIVYKVNEEKTAYTADLTNMTSTEIVIKDMIDGLPVTRTQTTVVNIADMEFRGTITSIKIPETVQSMGHYSFYQCSGLAEITVPEGVEFINEGTFQNCSSLTTVNLPNSLIKIGQSAFEGCKFTSITIPNGVETIGICAFGHCAFTDIIIPDSVTEIGRHAFYASNLTSITISDSVTKIGNQAFWYCSSLTCATIPNSVTEIGEGIFDNCKALETVYVDKGSYAEEYVKTNYPNIIIEYK